MFKEYYWHLGVAQPKRVQSAEPTLQFRYEGCNQYGGKLSRAIENAAKMGRKAADFIGWLIENYDRNSAEKDSILHALSILLGNDVMPPYDRDRVSRRRLENLKTVKGMGAES